tara:strand:- start:279 stop:593 length:315 start_codon:yes stop_codon:yes gene_type:complete
MAHEREVRLLSKSQNIHYILKIQSWDYLPKRCIKAQIFIMNSDCNKHTSAWADLSGRDGEVAICPIDFYRYRYSVPNWVRRVIKHELKMEEYHYNTRQKELEVA